MKPATLFVSGLALALVGYAAYSLRDEPQAPTTRDGAPDDEAEVAARRARGGGLSGPDIFALREQARQDATREGWSEPDPSRPFLERHEAVATFEAVMEELDAIAERGEELDPARGEELYRMANEAFAGLASKLDGADQEDRLQLNNAHILLREQLARLDITPPSLRDLAPIDRYHHSRMGPGFERTE